MMKKHYLVGLCIILLSIGMTTAKAQESKRKLGTHNSMTYMKPCSNAMLVTWPFAKCQSMTYTQQYDFGVRFFDLRIRFLNGTPYFAHGEVEFCEVDAYTVLDFLNRKGDCIVNLVLENTDKIGSSQNNQFIALAKECENRYTNTEFCGGWTKTPGDHPTIYQFKETNTPREERYKVFTILNEALDDAKSKNKKSGLLKKLGSGVKEFAQRPEGFAKTDNPGYWKEWLSNSGKENVILMLDFPEMGAPAEWIQSHPIKK